MNAHSETTASNTALIQSIYQAFAPATWLSLPPTSLPTLIGISASAPARCRGINPSPAQKAWRSSSALSNRASH